METSNSIAWLESRTGDYLMIAKRDDGDFYVETRSASVPPVVLILPKSEIDALIEWVQA